MSLVREILMPSAMSVLIDLGWGLFTVPMREPI